MEALIIEGTTDTPTIRFDPANNIFEMSGRSYPEDTHEFYTPVVDWMEEYATAPNHNTEFTFKLQYFNSSSYKPIFDVFSLLEEMKENGAEVLIKWYYKEADWDLKEAGEEFADIIEVPFSFHTL